MTAARLEICADLEVADRLDHEGRHTDAINVLVAAVRRGDVEALTRLGKRLLAGDRAPELPRDGLRMLRDAAARGSAEAPAVLAVTEAIGLEGPCNLSAARDLLVTAAMRGFAPAQSQLRVLAGATPEACDWCHVANAIDLDHWRAAPEGSDLSASPRIRHYPNFINTTVADWLIDRARARLAPAQVYDAVERRTGTHATRTNSAAVFDLLAADLVSVLVQQRMAACLAAPLRHFEAMTVLHYEPGQQIREHFDFVDPHVPDYEAVLRERGQRVVTFLVYLNDDYDGGCTEFPRLGIAHKGRAGAALYFENAFNDGSPDVRTLHAGRPPAGAPKWIVSQFIKSKPAF